jgi:hypothetical protein
MNLASLRQEYMRAGLSESDADRDPMRQFERWFEDALRAKLPLPNAMTLATASRDGTPSARVVLLKGVERVLEPALELPDRIALRVGFREARAHVFLAQVGDLHVGILPSRPANDWRFSLGKSLTRSRQFGIFSSTALYGGRDQY